MSWDIVVLELRSINMHIFTTEEYCAQVGHENKGNVNYAHCSKKASVKQEHFESRQWKQQGMRLAQSQHRRN